MNALKKPLISERLLLPIAIGIAVWTRLELAVSAYYYIAP